MRKTSKIYVAGHAGLVGSGLVRTLQKHGYTNLVLRSHAELDLAEAPAVKRFFESEKPEYVFLAAAKVGGILANAAYPADFIRDNLAIQNNVLEQAWRTHVKKLLFLGSSCIYPKECPQPIKEEYFLTGPLEQTNIAYATAKIAGVISAQSYHKQYGCNFISVMPTNIYGPGDNFDPETSHAFPALIRRFHEAAAANSDTVIVWGDGTPRREFLHVDDLADACLFLMNRYDSPEIVNVGLGEDVSIAAFAELIKNVSGFKGEIIWDKTKPNGTPRKLLDVSRLHALGWRHTITLEKGVKEIYRWYSQTYAHQ